jgi:hypothetical protein
MRIPPKSGAILSAFPFYSLIRLLSKAAFSERKVLHIAGMNWLLFKVLERVSIIIWFERPAGTTLFQGKVGA